MPEENREQVTPSGNLPARETEADRILSTLSPTARELALLFKREIDLGHLKLIPRKL